jgi:TrmH family RNA methyltransferase
MTAEISSLQNPLVQAARRLHQSSERRQSQKFLVEGTHLVEEALAVGWPLETVFFTNKWRDKHPSSWPSLVKLQQEPSITVRNSLIVVSDKVLASIATTIHPDGIVAVAKNSEQKAFDPNQFQFGIFAERLQNPDNLGTLIRSSVAAGASQLWTDAESVDDTNPKVLRSSAGQWFRMRPRRMTNLGSLIESLSVRNVHVLGASPDGRAYWEFDFERPTIFVLGNEGSGLSQQAIRHVDDFISIPMAPDVESLNVAVAGSILLFEVRRQRSLLC